MLAAYGAALVAIVSEIRPKWGNSDSAGDNGADVMLADEFPEHGGNLEVGPRGVTLHLAVDDADRWWNRAVEAGATVAMPLEDQFWGDRYGQLRDPFGHSWSIGAPIRD